MVAIPTRSLDLEAMLVRRLEGNRLRLPPYPAVAMKLQRLASSQRCSMRDVCRTIGVDAALVATVLQHANAAASGPVAAVTSLDAAVARIGIDRVLRLALAHGAGAIANATGPLALLRRDVWRRSLLAARIAQELAVARGLDGSEAFVAGLLHDFGAVTVLVGLEDLRVELPLLPATAWRGFVDRLQARFGAALAERWHLPDKITAAIRHCAAPHAYQGPARSLVELVGTTVRVIDILDRAPRTGIAALLELGALSDAERCRIGLIVREIADLMDAFEPARQDGPFAVAPDAPADRGWPIHFIVACKADTYEACALTPDTLVFRGCAPLAPNWLAQLALYIEPHAITMLATITSCTRDPDGTHTLEARPFGLDGKDKQAWLALVERTRPPRT